MCHILDVKVTCADGFAHAVLRFRFVALLPFSGRPITLGAFLADPIRRSSFCLEFPFCLFAVRYFGALAIARCCLVHRLVLVIKARCV